MESDFGQNAENGQTTMTPDHELVEGVSPSMRSLVSVMLEVAKSEVPVLLLAEKGAGKKATARRIHELSQRAGQGSGWFHALQWRLANSRIPAERTFWPAEVRFFWKSCPN